MVLAAGASRRFGGPKQLVRFRGRPLLEHALAAMSSSPVDQRLVVLGARAQEIIAELDLHGACPVICESWDEGQAASLRSAVAAADGAAAIVVVLGDQPLISPGAVKRVVESRGRAAVVRASYAGEPGHPVLLERRIFGRILALSGDTGARELIETGETHLEVPCDGLGAPTDVDTPQQLGELEQAEGGSGS